MRNVPAASTRQFGVFTSAQAQQAGWTLSAIRHALRTGTLVRIRAGVYADASVPTSDSARDTDARLVRSAAALGLTVPTVTVSHCSAAALMGLPLVSAPAHVCVTVPRGRRGRVLGAHVHRGLLTPAHLARMNGIRVTTPERTVVDIGCETGADAAIAAADVALSRGLATKARLREALAHAAGWPGVRSAARAVQLADPRAESPLESVSRLRMHDAAVPVPEPQQRVFDLSGRFLGRLDFYWDDVGVVGEADGLLKYDDRLSLRAEKRRQELLEQSGLIVVRWGWADLRDFTAVAARLHDAFAHGVRVERAARRWTLEPPALALPQRH